MQYIIYIAIFLITAVIFTIVGVAIRKKTAESKIHSAEQEAKKIIDSAKSEATSKMIDAENKLLEAQKRQQEEMYKQQEEIRKLRKELDSEIKERRGDVSVQEKRLVLKEENLEKKVVYLDKREKELEQRNVKLDERAKEIDEVLNKQKNELQRISGLTRADAKKQILSELDKELTLEKASVIKEFEQRTKQKAEKLGKEIISYAVQKCAADHTAETTVSIVELPNDDMKGRIIGREGRNIKALETLTGIDLIIDDTPEAVVLSGFDPLRREVAKIALQKLIEDGRIHPAKIEEMVEKAKVQLDTTITEEGERAVLETGVVGLHHDLVKLLGKLKYRTSYGQNVLNHSIEVSNLARIMAEELGLDAKLARRAGLLHDIGKALDHDMEGTHVEIGVDILKKYKESEMVINAVQAHHGDVEPKCLEAVLVQAADAISASRPGARRETLEAYIKRLEQLEGIADSFEGVEKSFAIQAGREVRIIVRPEKVDDSKMTVMAREIAKRIEDEMEYPGQIKVNIIRETKVVDYAK